MGKINCYEDLLKAYEEHKSILSLRRSGDSKSSSIDKREILVCGGTGCQSAESEEIISTLKSEIASAGLQDKVKVSLTGCFGFCEKGPIVKVDPDDVFYIKVRPSDAHLIVTEHLVNNKIVNSLLYEEPTLKKKVTKQDDMSFYKKQMRIALRNCGLINPEVIEEAIAEKAYMSLGKVLTEMSQDKLIKLIMDSGLRGRGGGGFSTGQKWHFAKLNNAPEKYIICNADEGDPGAFMDRSILEGDPHSIIESMAITGYATGSTKGFIYIRAEYPLAIKRLQIAIKQARDWGFLGDNIMGTGFSFDIFLKYGAGAFVCGEETALINSIEGFRGEPRNKPPFPAQRGLWQKPTTVNNVETLANIPPIILKGADWFNSIGTETSKGTKVFALAGKINNVGLVEVPMGTSLRDIIFEIGGGIKHDRKFKAVQTGGPSGGCIPASLLDTPIDYESLNAIGSMMGSGGMIVMDETDCMVNIAKFYLEFTLDESCGKCTPCRIGNTRLFELLEKICEGNATEEDLDTMIELSEIVKDTSLCGLGQTSPNPILANLKYFRDEFLAHINDKYCPAGSCKSLSKYFITDKCIGCTQCAKKCPVGCIDGELKKLHVINQDACIKCDTCYQVCPVNAIIK